MDLRQQLNEQMKVALKGGQKDRLSTLRMLLAELKNEDMRAGAKADDLSVVRRYAKKLSKSMEEFQRVGAEQRVRQVEGELAVVQEFLPQPLSEAELAEAIDRLLAEHGLTSPRHLGQAMGLLMKAYPGRVDGARAQQMLKAKLTGA
jgi:uncharacterized protein YqeY